MSKILSCLTLIDTYKSIYSILGISKHEINDFLFRIEDGADISINEFINIFNININQQMKLDYILVAHVTTAFDRCEYIKKNGLTNTRMVFENKTPLNNFLEENDIEIKKINGEYELYYKGNYINIKDGDLSLKRKLESDYQINAIFYSDDVINYGNVKYFPEILSEINKKVPILIEDLWRKKTKPYILTLKIKIDEIKFCTFDDADNEFDINNFTSYDKYKWLIKKALRYIYDFSKFHSVSDKYIFLNDDVDIKSDNIVDIKQVSR